MPVVPGWNVRDYREWVRERKDKIEQLIRIMTRNRCSTDEMRCWVCVYVNISSEDVSWDSGSFISSKVFHSSRARLLLASRLFGGWKENGKSSANRAKTSESESDIHCSCKERFNFFLDTARDTRAFWQWNLFKTSHTPHRKPLHYWAD